MMITLMRFFYVPSRRLAAACQMALQSVRRTISLSVVSEIVVQVDRFQISVMQRDSLTRGLVGDQGGALLLVLVAVDLIPFF